MLKTNNGFETDRQSKSSFSQYQDKARFMILGGEGFIGRNLVAALARTQRCVSVGETQSVFLERTDTFLKMDPYTEIIPNAYDVIIHLIDHKIPLDQFEAAEKKLAENLSLYPGNHLIVFSSSVVSANPESEYGRRKILLEKFYTDYCGALGIPLTIVRPFNLFGPYHTPYRQGSLVANLIYNYLNGKPTDINDMEAKRDFMYARDISQFIQYVLDHKLEGTYDIGSGTLMAIKDIISILEKKILKDTLKIINRNIKEDIAFQSARIDVFKSLCLSSLEEGLQQTVEFYRHHMNILKQYVG